MTKVEAKEHKKPCDTHNISVGIDLSIHLQLESFNSGYFFRSSLDIT